MNLGIEELEGAIAFPEGVTSNSVLGFAASFLEKVEMLSGLDINVVLNEMNLFTTTGGIVTLESLAQNSNSYNLPALVESYSSMLAFYCRLKDYQIDPELIFAFAQNLLDLELNGRTEAYRQTVNQKEHSAPEGEVIRYVVDELMPGTSRSWIRKPCNGLEAISLLFKETTQAYDQNFGNLAAFAESLSRRVSMFSSSR